MTITRSKIDYNRMTLVKNGVTQQSLTLQLTSVATGSSVANWREKAKAGVQAGSEYHMSKTRIVKRKVQGVRFRYESKFVPGVINDDTWSGEPGYDSIIASPLSSTTEVENKSLVKIHKKIRQESSHMNGWSFTGELREAIHGLRHPYESMRQAIYGHLTQLSKRKLSVNRFPPKKRQQAWRKVLADTWLETTFGLQPLVHDAKDLAESIGRFQFEPPRKVRISAKSEESQSDVVRDINVPMFTGGLAADRWRETVWTNGCRYVVGMEGSTVANFGAADRLRQVLGFNLENFVPGLHEILPWSWLFDYFSNMGDIILAATTDESRVKWIVKSVYRKTAQAQGYDINVARTLINMANANSVVKSLDNRGNYCTLIQQECILDRTLPSSLGVPVFRTEHPFGKPKQMGNLLAVLAQFSGRSFDPSMARALRPASLTAGQRATFGRNSLDFVN